MYWTGIPVLKNNVKQNVGKRCSSSTTIDTPNDTSGRIPERGTIGEKIVFTGNKNGEKPSILLLVRDPFHMDTQFMHY